MLRYIASLIIAGMLIPSAFAESGKFQKLEWKNPQEELVYHTCGCADACWVADLTDAKTHQSKIKLSCDCEQMELTINGTKTVYQDNCQAFENEDKFQKIVDAITTIQSTK